MKVSVRCRCRLCRRVFLLLAAVGAKLGHGAIAGPTAAHPCPGNLRHLVIDGLDARVVPGGVLHGHRDQPLAKPILHLRHATHLQAILEAGLLELRLSEPVIQDLQEEAFISWHGLSPLPKT